MKRWIPAGAALGVVLVASACWHDDSASGPTEPVTEGARANQTAAAASGTVATAGNAAPSQSAASAAGTAQSGPTGGSEPEAFRGIRASIRNSAQWRNAAWVGEVHTKMMNEFTHNRDRWLSADASGQCRLLMGVTQKYLAQIQREHAVFAGRDQRALAARFVREQQACAGANPMSIMGAPTVEMQSYVYSPEDGEPVTGAYQPYVAQIEAAVEYGGTPASIASAVDAVLASAAGIPDPDLQVVYASASLALESTYYWYDYEVNYGWGGGGGGGGGGDHQIQAMSLFGAGAFQKSWGRGAAVDAISCGIGMADKYWLSGAGPVGWKILAGACALYGGGGSLLYAIS